MAVLATAIREEKEIKQMQAGKEVKLSLFVHDIILHTENPKDATRKLELINEFGKVTGYKINAKLINTFLFKILYLFIFVCAGSLLLCMGFL